SIVEDAVSIVGEEEPQEEIPAPAKASSPWPAAPPQPTEDAEFAIVSDPDSDQAASQEEVQEEAQPEEAQHEQEEDQAAPVAESETAPAEIDLSSEWDDSVTVEA